MFEGKYKEMTLYLNREAMRLVKTNDKGRVTKRKRYKFGDEVDETFFDGSDQEGRLDTLLEKGTLVESEDDLDRRAGFKYATTGVGSASQRRGQATTVDAAVGAAGASPRPGDAGTPLPDAEEGALVPEPTHEDEDQGAGAPADSEDDVEMVDEYSSMDYADLQQEAKGRGINAGGSADDIRARLREDDNS
jgi:hypothetical protein